MSVGENTEKCFFVSNSGLHIFYCETISAVVGWSFLGFVLVDLVACLSLRIWQH